MRNYSNVLLESLVAVIGGYITLILMQALSGYIGYHGVPHIVYVVLVITMVIEFISGLRKLYALGAFYFISLIFFGVLVGEMDSVIVGIISVITYFSGIYLGRVSI
jgi:hypothetical protein